MSVLDTIIEKRDGGTHDREAIEELVGGVVSGDIPDYQLAAWLMAVYFRGLNAEEAGTLTDVMIRSGEVIDLSSLSGPLVDKHSTGGVGDKVSLILAPMVAACGVQVPMMSGRGLGHTGGTLDKLESIPGYSTALDAPRFREVIAGCGYSMIGQSERVVPADRIMYAMRDVTGTVESIPLITASILSKKFAEGAQSLVFDVKCGAGAFMKTPEDARTLARSLTDASKALGRPVVACITRMDAPLGYKVGNSLEVEESLDALEGRGPEDLMRVVFRLGGWMLVAAGFAPDPDAGEARCREAIEDGSALQRFRENVRAQGGEVDRLTGGRMQTLRSPEASVVRAKSDGVVTGIDAFAVGSASVLLGAGRTKAEDSVDHGAGVELAVRVGDRVSAGDVLCRTYAAGGVVTERAESVLSRAFTVLPGTGVAGDGGEMILEEISEL